MNEHEHHQSEIDDHNDQAIPNPSADADETNIESTEKRVAAFDKLVDWFIEFDPYQIKAYVEDVRIRYPELSDDRIADKIIDIKAIKNGLVGAATGIPGFLTMPITVPADLLMTWKIQINLALCIAYVYGQNIENIDSDELKTDIYMVLAGKSAKECLKVLGVEIDTVTQKAVKRYVGRELMSGIWKQIARRIAMTTGRKSAYKMSRMVPLIGAPIGFAFDYSATKSVGSFARAYYRGNTIVDVEVN